MKILVLLLKTVCIPRLLLSSIHYIGALSYLADSLNDDLSNLEASADNPSNSLLLAQSKDLLTLTNNFRSQNYLSPLKLDTRLTNAAQTQADYMCALNTLSHENISPNNTLSDRLRNNDFIGSNIGENIARQQGSNVDEVFKVWKSSDEHRKNLLGEYENMGVGVCKRGGYQYWVQVFGKESNNYRVKIGVFGNGKDSNDGYTDKEDGSCKDCHKNKHNPDRKNSDNAINSDNAKNSDNGKNSDNYEKNNPIKNPNNKVDENGLQKLMDDLNNNQDTSPNDKRLKEIENALMKILYNSGNGKYRPNGDGLSSGNNPTEGNTQQKNKNNDDKHDYSDKKDDEQFIQLIAKIKPNDLKRETKTLYKTIERLSTVVLSTTLTINNTITKSIEVVNNKPKRDEATDKMSNDDNESIQKTIKIPVIDNDKIQFVPIKNLIRKEEPDNEEPDNEHKKNKSRNDIKNKQDDKNNQDGKEDKNRSVEHPNFDLLKELLRPILFNYFKEDLKKNMPENGGTKSSLNNNLKPETYSVGKSPIDGTPYKNIFPSSSLSKNLFPDNVPFKKHFDYPTFNYPPFGDTPPSNSYSKQGNNIFHNNIPLSNFPINNTRDYDNPNENFPHQKYANENQINSFDNKNPVSDTNQILNGPFSRKGLNNNQNNQILRNNNQDNQRPQNNNQDNQRPQNNNQDNQRPQNNNQDNQRPQNNNQDNQRPQNNNQNNQIPSNNNQDNQRPSNNNQDNQKMDRQLPNNHLNTDNSANTPRIDIYLKPNLEKTSNSTNSNITQPSGQTKSNNPYSLNDLNPEELEKLEDLIHRLHNQQTENFDNSNSGNNNGSFNLGNNNGSSNLGNNNGSSNPGNNNNGGSNSGNNSLLNNNGPPENQQNYGGLSDHKNVKKSNNNGYKNIPPNNNESRTSAYNSLCSDPKFADICSNINRGEFLENNDLASNTRNNNQINNSGNMNTRGNNNYLDQSGHIQGNNTNSQMYNNDQGVNNNRSDNNSLNDNEQSDIVKSYCPIICKRDKNLAFSLGCACESIEIGVPLFYGPTIGVHI